MSAAGDVRQAIDRLRLYFAGSTTRQGILARRALDEPAADDPALAERLVAEWRAELRTDGSVGGAAVPTIWRAQEFMDIGHGGDQPGTVRVMRWVLSLQGKSGVFGEGCSSERHAHRACQHYTNGFFSPAPPAQRVAPVMLPDGKVFRAEPAARFAISCLAFRSAVRAGYTRRPLVEQHLASLLRLQEIWTGWNGYFGPDVIVSGLRALVHAPPQHHGAVCRLAAMVAAQQDPEGTWPNADLFHTLDALLAANTAEARAAVCRAAPALLARQRPDGSFGATAQHERALIGLLVLLEAQRAGSA